MIDKGFLRSLEGFSLVGYVPDAEGSRSGVTVATGVDLAHTNVYLLDISNELRTKLSKYHGVIGQAAVGVLDKNPLHLTESEAKELSDAVYDVHTSYVETAWNSDSALPWLCLPTELRTVVFSVIYQYGRKERVPKFWNFCTSLKWKEVVTELRNFGDRYPTRRNKEADYLEAHINA